MKHWNFFAIIALGIIVAFTACDNDNGNKDPCNCDPIAHMGIDENCNCGLKDCNCTEQIVNLDGITIHKNAGVTVKQMSDAVENIEEAYSDLSPTQKNAFKERVNEIIVDSGSNYNLPVNGSVIIGHELSYDDIYDIFIEILY